MNNPFIEIIRTAREYKWCTTPYCTTCGTREYRQALKQLGGEVGGGLVNALTEINPTELTKENNWQDALLVAIIDLPLSLQLEGILKAWLPKLNEDIDFADFVLYKIIRYMPKGSDIRNKCIDNCISLAEGTKRFSLIESLILVLGKTSFEHQEIIEIAKEYAKSSNQMRRVLRNACGIELRDA